MRRFACKGTLIFKIITMFLVKNEEKGCNKCLFAGFAMEYF